MSTPNTTRWMGIGLLGLPLYGALTFFSSLEGQPDPSTQLEAWSRFVTTNEYVWGHLFGSIFGLIFVIFGLFALGVYLATSYAPRLGLAAMVINGGGQRPVPAAAGGCYLLCARGGSGGASGS